MGGLLWGGWGGGGVSFWGCSMLSALFIIIFHSAACHRRQNTRNVITSLHTLNGSANTSVLFCFFLIKIKVQFTIFTFFSRAILAIVAFTLRDLLLLLVPIFLVISPIQVTKNSFFPHVGHGHPKHWVGKVTVILLLPKYYYQGIRDLLANRR